MKRTWYAGHDSDDEIQDRQGFFEIAPHEARPLNEKGYGIFWSVNEFLGPRRKDNLVRINAWAIDMDQGSKAEQWARIKRFLIPSLVVETRSGFHVYFNAKDGTAANWEAIVWDRLVPVYGADRNAKDYCRMLRVPGYYHMKDPNNPYLIHKVYESGVSYTEADMLGYYKIPEEKRKEKEARSELRQAVRSVSASDDLWQRIWEMDCVEALERLSGSVYVNGEIFTFRRVPRGNLNIWVNGKGTSAWIDANGRIGSLSKGGPTVWQWLRWYGHSDKRVYQIMREVFPELFPVTDVNARRTG